LAAEVKVCVFKIIACLWLAGDIHSVLRGYHEFHSADQGARSVCDVIKAKRENIRSCEYVMRESYANGIHYLESLRGSGPSAQP